MLKYLHEKKKRLSDVYRKATVQVLRYIGTVTQLCLKLQATRDKAKLTTLRGLAIEYVFLAGHRLELFASH